MKIAIQGERGSFSHEAARRMVPGCEIIACARSTEVFDRVERGSAQAAVIPLSGWMSDRFGAKRIYLISLVLFSLGSALCGMAMSAETLIAARVLQGLGGGMLMPIGMAVLFRLTPPERRGRISP